MTLQDAQILLSHAIFCVCVWVCVLHFVSPSLNSNVSDNHALWQSCICAVMPFSPVNI